MENEEEKQSISDTRKSQQATADSSPTRPSDDLRDGKPPSPPSAKSPADSPPRSSISSDKSHQSALSHGSSPGEEKLPVKATENPPGNYPAKSPSAKSPADSPTRSSISSDKSHQSPLSHGSSPGEEKLPVKATENPPGNFPAKPPSPETVVNLSVIDEPVLVTKKDPEVRDGFRSGVVEEGDVGGRQLRSSLSILRKMKRDAMVKKATLGFRLFGMAFCLVSLSVMAADKNQGWALDSFHRYKEFRYCISVNVIGFVYSSVQAGDVAYHLATGKYVYGHQLRYYFDFSVDQMLTYLLISGSSSAATRVEDWISNWGKDKFPDLASASVAMSFLASAALASSSLISGYALSTFKSL